MSAGMSGPGENRGWRRTGPPNRPPQDRSGTNTPNRDAGRQQAMTALTGNAWGAAKGKNTDNNRSGPLAAAPVPAEQQVAPARDSNAAEIRDFLKMRYVESVADQAAAYHKVQGDSVPKRSSGAWGAKGTMSHLMPNGQDFFTQLKKQLQNLEQGKPS